MYVGQYIIRSKGVWISRLQLSDWNFLNIPIVLPPAAEQTAIANFLDQKLAEIDGLVTRKKKLIELLEERKRKEVSQILHEGAWPLKKLKFVVTKIGSGVTPTGGAASYATSGIPLLRSQNVYDNKLVLDDVAFITETVHNSMSNSKVKTGDVLLNITGGSIGRSFYVQGNLGEANVNQHVCIIRPHTQKVLTQFLHLLLISNLGQKQIWYSQTGSGREGLNFSALSNFRFPVPTLYEQQQVIEEIERSNQRINQVIADAEREIALLQEYRTTLIVEAVTGKMEVRAEGKVYPLYPAPVLQLAAEPETPFVV